MGGLFECGCCMLVRLCRILFCLMSVFVYFQPWFMNMKVTVYYLVKLYCLCASMKCDNLFIGPCPVGCTSQSHVVLKFTLVGLSCLCVNTVSCGSMCAL